MRCFIKHQIVVLMNDSDNSHNVIIVFYIKTFAIAEVPANQTFSGYGIDIEKALSNIFGYGMLPV